MSNMEDNRTRDQVADPVGCAHALARTMDKRVDILRKISLTGSISSAARAAGVSYKAAWQAIETLENLAGGKLVNKAVGGQNGGGTSLTLEGMRVLEIADKLQSTRVAALEELSLKTNEPARNLSPSVILTSMRNNLPCTIEAMRKGVALVRVVLRLDDENTLKASVSHESVELLGLEPGMKIVASTKATAVSVARELPIGYRGNRLEGKVVRTSRSSKGGEVTIRLASGLVVAGFAKRGHGLAIGTPAVAVVPPNAIVLARSG